MAELVGFFFELRTADRVVNAVASVFSPTAKLIMRCLRTLGPSQPSITFGAMVVPQQRLQITSTLEFGRVRSDLFQRFKRLIANRGQVLHHHSLFATLANFAGDVSSFGNARNARNS